ncbi:hypothetical protein ACE17E_25330 [Escherichia coli]|uniref:hypothetical protein n=1 Tax=Escherichia coli TaxID=562 RepID=UPI000B7CE328|nr:hypothetical protein [Escherichia coli]EEV6842226.1 hypothetical protein [Escherichia coli]EEW0666026.1 hypothetical protein [Escherichia coli]EEZ5528214.1 hypothetical protein [Escherichia coli]EFB2543056.1 hypothetical protein [Escherichia coli]EFB8851399.1 hypothetical protein [Escherichia coli]
MEQYIDTLTSIDDEQQLLDFCRKKILHGTPFIFKDREDEYYEFRKKIANEFNIDFHNVLITGSGKLGFSPYKLKKFDMDSDIDVAIVSSKLYDEIMVSIFRYQRELRENRIKVSDSEIDRYHRFLEYGALGWMRPDLLPLSFNIKELKDKWFDFFDSLSYGRSEVGNYKVAAGAFKSYWHLENYTMMGLTKLKNKYKVKEVS